MARITTLAGALGALAAVLTPVAVIATSQAQQPVALYSDDEVVASSIPVDLSSNTPVQTMRVVVPVAAGDVLDITAEGRVTNDVGYNIGVGSRLQWYDVDDGVPWPHTLPWTQIGTPTGDNVPPQRHHMPLTLTRVYKVPESWPAGHRMVVNLLVDAHSTAWRSGDKLTVDNYGQLVVRRWSAPE